MVEEDLPEDIRQLVDSHSPRVQRLAYHIHEFVVHLECHSYVKTIYVGYEIGGAMVAALYPYRDRVDLALAIPEDTVDPILVDASHLTWRSLPLLASIRTQRDLARAKKYVVIAVDQVRSGTHTVNRDNDFFIRTKHERRAKRDSLRKQDSRPRARRS